LRLARGARAAFPCELDRPLDRTYGPTFFCQILPEAARRMRASGLLQQEAARGETRLQSDADLRRTIGTYLERCRLAALAARGGPLSPVAILTRDPGVGNPVAMAADRLAPAAEAGADLGDTLARLVRKACRLSGHARPLRNGLLTCSGGRNPRTRMK